MASALTLLPSLDHGKREGMPSGFTDLRQPSVAHPQLRTRMSSGSGTTAAELRRTLMTGSWRLEACSEEDSLSLADSQMP